jgi:hypothetical protein
MNSNSKKFTGKGPKDLRYALPCVKLREEILFAAVSNFH